MLLAGRMCAVGRTLSHALSGPHRAPLPCRMPLRPISHSNSFSTAAEQQPQPQSQQTPPPSSAHAASQHPLISTVLPTLNFLDLPALHANLVAAGFSEDQASAILNALVESVEDALSAKSTALVPKHLKERLEDPRPAASLRDRFTASTTEQLAAIRTQLASLNAELDALASQIPESSTRTLSKIRLQTSLERSRIRDEESKLSLLLAEKDGKIGENVAEVRKRMRWNARDLDNGVAGAVGVAVVAYGGYKVWSVGSK